MTAWLDARGADADAVRRVVAEVGEALQVVLEPFEPKDLPALRYAFVQDPNGIRVELVKRNLKPFFTRQVDAN